MKDEGEGQPSSSYAKRLNESIQKAFEHLSATGPGAVLVKEILKKLAQRGRKLEFFAPRTLHAWLDARRIGIQKEEEDAGEAVAICEEGIGGRCLSRGCNIGSDYKTAVESRRKTTVGSLCKQEANMLRQAEIYQRNALAVVEDIGWTKVAMHDAALLQMFESIQELQSDTTNLLHTEYMALLSQPESQGRTRYELLHDEIRGTMHPRPFAKSTTWRIRVYNPQPLRNGGVIASLQRAAFGPNSLGIHAPLAGFHQFHDHARGIGERSLREAGRRDHGIPGG